jgi:hypothetical protein
MRNKKMGMDEQIFQILAFIFLLPSIGFLIFLLSSFIDLSPSIETSFTSVCESQGSVYLFSDYQVSNSEVAFHFLDSDSLTKNFEYNEKGFSILSSLYNDVSLKEIINTESDKIIFRKDYGLMNACKDESCLCIASTNVQNFNFDNFELTACFPRLYSNIQAQQWFDEEAKSLPDKYSSYEIFSQSISYVLEKIDESSDNELKEIKACYEFMSNNNFNQLVFGSDNFEYLNDERIMSSNNAIGEFLLEFYDLTQAGLMYDLKSCAKIPNQDNCIHTSDVRSNFMILPFEDNCNLDSCRKSYSLFIGYNSDENKVSIRGKIIKLMNLIEINTEEYELSIQ